MKINRKILETLAENGALRAEDFPDFGLAHRTIIRRLTKLQELGKVHGFRGRGHGRPYYWSLDPRDGTLPPPPPSGRPPCMTQADYDLWRSGGVLAVACRDCTPEYSEKMHALGKCPVYNRIIFRADRDGFIAGYFKEDKNDI